MKTCSIDGCTRLGNKHSNGKRYFPKGFCEYHYTMDKKYGNPLLIRRKPYDGRGGHPLYVTYRGMIARCYDHRTTNYHKYGLRGITVCDRWCGLDGFANFVIDMGVRPAERTLDRINTDGNYEPLNCRWATIHQQAANTRSNNPIVGVSWDSRRSKWRASLKVNRAIVMDKSFKSMQDAVEARLCAEKKWGLCSG